MYRPPSSNSDYFKGILDIIEAASLEDKEYVVLGDLNYDYKIDETLSSNPIHYIENLYGMTQLISKATRVTMTSSTLIDIILTTAPDNHDCN